MAVPRVDLTLSVDVERTPRVVQLEGMFDVPEAKRRTVDFHFDAPIEERGWQIGLIVGPSGAGKTSVARHLFGECIVDGYDWHPTRSIIDSFGELPIRDVVAALSSVGFASPPSWTKPYAVLSNGEKFRATMARALLDDRQTIVIDEFTSVIDRTVARIGAHAVAKAVRRKPGKRFVAVSCHDDIVEWLQPDWILEPHVGRFAWRSVQRRPAIELEIVRVDHSAWGWFAPHHYLTADLNRTARCFAGLVEGRPAAFVGSLPVPHAKVNLQSVSRVVVLPDFQGAGLAMHMIGAIARVAKAAVGKTMIIGTSHPGLVGALARSADWRLTRAGFRSPVGKTGKKNLTPEHAKRRRVAHFKWVGSAHHDPQAARMLWA